MVRKDGTRSVEQVLAMLLLSVGTRIRCFIGHGSLVSSMRTGIFMRLVVDQLCRIESVGIRNDSGSGA